jgi:hypothetical protein
LKRIPSFGAIRKEIEDSTVTASLQFLAAHSAVLQPFPDLETYAFAAPDPLPKDLRAFEYHFNVVRWQFLKTLRSHGVFLGSSIIDELLFASIRDFSVKHPVKEVLEIVRRNGIYHPGMVVYPLHSFGISGAGFLEAWGKEKVDLIVPEAGFAVRAQTRSLKGTVDFLQNAARSLKVQRRIPIDSLEHYDRLQVLKWLTHNPLLVVKVRTFSGEYYENQAFIVIKLKIATTAIFMLSALETGLARKSEAWSSTRNVNNYQTLDIRHYVVLEPRPRSKTAFEARRVPMNVSATELAELTAVPVSITRGAWMRRRKFIQQICSALLRVESNYLKAIVNPKIKSSQSQVYRKLFESLAYFRRSFRLTSDPGEAYVNLAVAFEVLLTDSYAKGVETRIRKRLRKVLQGVKGSRSLNTAAGNLYKARSEVVHTGSTSTVVDVPRVRRAFVHAFVVIVEKAHLLPPTAKEPIKAIVGV